MQYNIKPGTYESISDVSIGTFVLNVVTNFKLDGNYPFLLSDVVVKQGTTIISSSNYTLSIDTSATTQESGQSAKTLYGAIKITNPTYAGVELNVSGNNFGTYTSNQATVDALEAGLLTKTSATGSDINEGEIAEFAGTGQDIKSSNSASVAQWDVGTIYNTAGTLVRREGITYTATGEATNQGIDPSDSDNALYWYESDNAKDLKRYANRCTILDGDFHTVNDRSGSNYLTSLLINKSKVGGADKEFHMLHLDGSIVTGDATLEALLAGNPYIDLIAPDNLGTRTLIDMSSTHIAPMSSGGENDVLGAWLENRFQGHSHKLENLSQGGVVSGIANNTGTDDNKLSRGDSSSRGAIYARAIETDSVNGTPRIGLTTRPNELTVGSSYIIVMK